MLHVLCINLVKSRTYKGTLFVFSLLVLRLLLKWTIGASGR
jgi:hypothetical protein